MALGTAMAATTVAQVQVVAVVAYPEVLRAALVAATVVRVVQVVVQEDVNNED